METKKKGFPAAFWVCACTEIFERLAYYLGPVSYTHLDVYKRQLVKVDRDLLMIPSLAIHMDRKVNEGRAVNKQIDMLPVLSGSVKEQGEVRSLVAEELGLKDTDIYGMDLFLYNRMGAVRWGSCLLYTSNIGII